MEVARTLESSSGDLAKDDALRFEHGIAFADLAPITDPSLVLSAIAGVLGMSNHGTAEIASVRALVGSSRILIVLDNCEQVRDTCSRIVADLLTHCPGARVLATSREYLAIRGERILPVAPLAIAGPDDVLGRRDLSGERRQQILESERSSCSSPAWTTSTRGTYCRGTHLPTTTARLGVDVAPARRDPARHRAGLARLPPRTRPPGRRRCSRKMALFLMPSAVHVVQSVGRRRGASALAWSVDRLEPLERELFRMGLRLRGPFTFEAPCHLASPAVPNHARRRTRCMILLEKFDDRRRRHRGTVGYSPVPAARDHAGLRSRAARAARPGRRGDCARPPRVRLPRRRRSRRPRAPRPRRTGLPRDRGRGAVELPGGSLVVVRPRGRRAGERLAGALHWFFGRMGQYDELCKRLDVVLERRESMAEPLRLRAALARSTLAWSVGEYEGKEALAEEAINLAEAPGNDHQLLIALIVRAGIAAYSGDGRRAAECVFRAKPMAETLDDAWAQGWVALAEGISERRSGRLASAEERCHEALRLFEAMDNDQGRILPLVNLAILSQQQGRFRRRHPTVHRRRARGPAAW